MAIRIAFIVPTSKFAESTRRVDLLVRHLPRDKFETVVLAIAPDGPQLDAWRATGIWGDTFPSPQFVRDYTRLRAALGSIAPDIAHVVEGDWNAGQIAALKGQVRHIVEDRAAPVEGLGLFRAVVHRSIRPLVKRVITWDENALASFVSHGYAAKHVLSIPLGVEAEPMWHGRANAETLSARRELLRRLELPDDSRLIATAGPLVTQGRFKDLIWSMELLKSVQPTAQLLILGNGPEAWRLQRYTRQVELDEYVCFFDESLDPRELFPHLDCYYHAGAQLVPSPWMMQAMGAGVPVVASDTTIHRRYLRHNETGFLVPLGDRAEFARRANGLISDHELARRIGDAGRAFMLREFPARRMVEQFAALYTAIVGNA